MGKNKRNSQAAWTFLLDLPLGKRKKIKDPIHKDIRLTKTEIKLIDTEDFQRLRFIRQLGPAYLVYPSANHTRFEHSLGTLYLTQQIIDEINSHSSERLIDDRATFIARLVALLHDLAHLPFGHTLEDEGRLFEHKQWLSETRHKRFFEPVAKILNQDIVEAFKRCNQDGRLDAEKAIRQIKETLIADEKGNAHQLEEPYIADIVGNTICADLFDYLKRDSYFTGISESYDERVTSYFTIQTVSKDGIEKRRVVIQLFKEGKNTEEVRHDVLSALTGLLESRYSIGEKVYFHHTKRVASAMIIKIVASALKAEIIDEDKLCALDDVSLIHFIRTSECNIYSPKRPYLDAAKKLIECLGRRDLYKPVYQLSLDSIQNHDKIDELTESWEKRYEFEEELEELINANKGDVIVYTPRKGMNTKQAEALVQLPIKVKGLAVYPLNRVSELQLPAEYRDLKDILKGQLETLEMRHRSLWKFSIFAHRKIRNNLTKYGEIREYCKEVFGMKGLSQLAPQS